MQSLPGDPGALLDLLVDLTILGGALAAAWKFRVFDVMGHRYRSEVWCTSTPAGDGEPGRVLFVGNYVVHNTGNRPLRVSRVRISLLEPLGDEPILDSDRTRELVRREFGSDRGSSWFRIGPGERSIFPLRVYLDGMARPVFVQCEFDWAHRGRPSEFVWLYDPRLPMTWRSEPTGALPDRWDPSTVEGAGLTR